MRPLTIVIDGELLSVKEAARKYGLKPATILARHRKGATGNALVAPVLVQVPPTYICKTCGKAFQSSPSNQRMYCSKACYKPSGRLSHGNSYSRLHAIWCGMRSRCRGANSPLIKKYYRDRGITVCDEWSKFENFRDWAFANGYADGLEIDRIDNLKGYSPDNCRWATRAQQMANTRKRQQANATSRFKGVSYCRHARLKWRACGCVNSKPVHLGLFPTEVEAARAYDRWAVAMYGEFACVNFPQEAIAS